MGFRKTVSSNGAIPGGAAGGDLGGTFPNPSVQKLQGTTPSSFGLDLIDEVNAAAVRSKISAEASGTAAGLVATHEAASDPHGQYALDSSLGTMASQNANNVSITGGSISGVSGLAVAGSAIIAADDITTILSSSSNSQFIRSPSNPSVIKLRARKWIAEADAKTNVPSLYTLNNNAEVSSASIDSSGILTWTTTSAVKSFYNGTDTSGRWTRNLPGLFGCDVEYIFRLGGSTLPTEQNVVFVITNNLSAQTQIAVDVYNNSGTYRLRTLYENTGSTNLDTCTLAQAQAGIWYRVRIVNGWWYIFYNKTLGGTTRPTEAQWTFAFSRQMSTTYLYDYTRTTWNYLFTTSTNTNGAGTWHALFDAEIFFVDQNRVKYSPLCGAGYPATSDSIVIATCDFGSAKALPDITKMRLMLADMENRTSGDAVTWTWSLTGSDSASPAAATTYQDAGSLTLKQPSSDTTESTARRYWTLRAIGASASSTTAGSLDIGRCLGVIAAPA